MAVVTLFVPRVAPLPNDDRRLPTATWYGRGVSIGDASGGLNTNRMRMNTSQRILFSYEDFAYIATVLAGRVAVRFTGATLGNEERGILFERSYDSASDVITGGGAALGGETYIPNFIFETSSGPTTDVCDVSKANTNGEQLEAILWGYIWDMAALQLPGGPIRPGQFPQIAPERGFRPAGKG